jgi:ABC-type glycerol-3-phosphate transport system substrate-binding protein
MMRYASRASRRVLLRAATLIAASTGGAALLAACGGTPAGTSSIASSGSNLVSTQSSAAHTTGSQVTTIPTAAKSTATGTTAPVATTTTAATAEAAPVTTSAASIQPAKAAGALQVWMPGEAFSLNTGVGAEIAKAFLVANPGITLDASVQSSLEKFKTQVAAGTPPDLVDTEMYPQTTWGVTGIVQALDGYVAKSQNVKPDDIWPYHWQEGVWQGKVYGIPTDLDNRVIYANADLYQRAGLDPKKLPATWSDMESAASKTVVLEDGKTLKQLGWDPFGGSGGRYTWLVPFWQLGGNFSSTDGSTVTIANEQGITSLEWTAKIYDLQGGYQPISDFTKNLAKSNGVQLWVDSHAAMVYGTIATKAQYKLAEHPELTYSVAQYPLPPNGKPATYAGAGAFCIGTGAKHADAAFSLIDFFYRPDMEIKWAIGQLRVPSRMSVARSVDYTQNDPMLKLTVDAMPYGRFVPCIPGAEQMLPIINTAVLNVLQKKMDARASLEDAQTRCQQELDKYRK